MEQRRMLIRLALALAGLVALCALGAAASLAGAPRTFRSHEETVADALRRRQIAYTEIRFEQSFEESHNWEFYRASIQVVLPDQQIAYGYIGCENRDSECFLDVRSLGIRGLALPELTRASPPPWTAWQDRAARYLAWLW
jgi:hypothetical protein